MPRVEPTRSRARPTGSFGAAKAGQPAHATLNIAAGKGGRSAPLDPPTTSTPRRERRWCAAPSR